jgi:hypothetical protein
MNIPEYMLQKLRGRLGLEKDDKSRDEKFYQMSPVKIVKECTAWELGDAGWATIIAEWIVAVNADPKDFLK